MSSSGQVACHWNISVVGECKHIRKQNGILFTRLAIHQLASHLASYLTSRYSYTCRYSQTTSSFQQVSRRTQLATLLDSCELGVRIWELATNICGLGRRWISCYIIGRDTVVGKSSNHQAPTSGCVLPRNMWLFCERTQIGEVWNTSVLLLPRQVLLHNNAR